MPASGMTCTEVIVPLRGTADFESSVSTRNISAEVHPSRDLATKQLVESEIREAVESRKMS